MDGRESERGKVEVEEGGGGGGRRNRKVSEWEEVGKRVEFTEKTEMRPGGDGTVR
jgi:hypothetical protein